MRQTSSEVKPSRAGLVLGWLTTFKQKPLCPFCYFLYCKSNFFFSHYHSFSVVLKHSAVVYKWGRGAYEWYFDGIILHLCITFLCWHVGIYGVGKAAIHPPALAVLSHKPPSASRTVAWVGKGIVYDTGGLSIKTKVCCCSYSNNDVSSDLTLQDYVVA